MMVSYVKKGGICSNLEALGNPTLRSSVRSEAIAALSQLALGAEGLAMVDELHRVQSESRVNTETPRLDTRRVTRDDAARLHETRTLLAGLRN